MAKKIVNVDEELLRGYMSGEITVPSEEDVVQPEDDSRKEQAAMPPAEKGKARRKCGEESDYREIFPKKESSTPYTCCTE